MRILTWNVNFRPTESVEAICGLNADVVMLQEVKHGTVDGIAVALQRSGLEHRCYSGLASDERKRYGNITASRWPLSPAPRGWAPRMPWPQLALRATVHTPFGDIDAVNVHIPNGSGNGWRKVESLEALAEALEQTNGVARVLAGDFNEPQQVLPGGVLVTWGQLIDPGGSVRFGRRNSGGAGPARFKDKEGREDDLRRWDTAVRRIFEGTTEHGLRHVREMLGFGSADVPVTHVVQGRPRFFDHLFLSSHFRATDYCCVDSVRENLRHSDHSAVYADVEIEGETA